MYKHQGVTDREVYLALWITTAACLGAFLLWRFELGEPDIRACWFYMRFHIYCPACGGTRALIAFFHGRIGASFYYNPIVPLTIFSVGGYLLSQTLWRLRGRRGFVLRYSIGWLWGMLIVLAANCLVRNVLWFGFQIPL